jgi:predicted nucleic acid-binding protein
MNNILIDTCFWYGLYNKGDKYYAQSNRLVEYFSVGNIIIPYPTIYETINTKFTKNKDAINDFNKLLKRPQFYFIDDSDYKEAALRLTFDSAIKTNRNLSLVDMIIRLMLSDEKMNIDYLITYNIRDFIDICLQKKIEILSDAQVTND